MTPTLVLVLTLATLIVAFGPLVSCWRQRLARRIVERTVAQLEREGAIRRDGEGGWRLTAEGRRIASALREHDKEGRRT